MRADTCFCASHLLDEVQRICDRAVVLSAGQAIADAKVETRTMALELLLRGKGDA